MTTKKKVTPPQPAPISVQHCTFENIGCVSDKASEAVAAIAAAAQANAEALRAAANALKGSDGPNYGVQIQTGGGKE